MPRSGLPMSNSSYFSEQVERCLRLARMCSDNTVAERLRLMATEFQEQADRLTGRNQETSGAGESRS